MSVLSIHSHVSFGHVGNSSAVFALQRLGHEVWPVHVLQYSNHPGYGEFGGGHIAPEHVASTLAGVQKRGGYESLRAVLTGYLPSDEHVSVVAEALREIRAVNPNALIVCDPVLGDEETGLYVNPKAAAATREQLVGLADLMTPNRFELGFLLDIPSPPRNAVVSSARKLIERGPRWVVVTGVENGQEHIETRVVDPRHEYVVTTPRLDLGRRPDGAGDLLVASCLGQHLAGHSMANAVARAVSSTYAILDVARQRGLRELPIIERQEDLIAPTTQFIPIPGSAK